MFNILKGLGDAITEGFNEALRLFAKDVENNPLLLAPKSRRSTKEGYHPQGHWEAMFNAGLWQFWTSQTGLVVSGPAVVQDITGITVVEQFLVQLSEDTGLKDMIHAADLFPGRPGPILTSI